MVTILLEQIIEILKGWLSSFTSWAEDTAEKLGLIEEATEYIDDIYDETTQIQTNTSSIVTSNNMIQGYSLNISNKTNNIDNNVTAIKNNVGSIATSSGVTAAFAEDIATNTLNTDNRLVTIGSDTTQLRSNSNTITADVSDIKAMLNYFSYGLIVTEDVEGSICSFDTDLIDYIQNLKVAIEPDNDGFTSVNITRTGKNLIDWKISSTAKQVYLPSGNYTLSWNGTLASGLWYIRGYDESGNLYTDKSYLGLGASWTHSSSSHWNYASISTPFSFTVPEGCSAIELLRQNEDGTIYAQLETGSTATTYEPYKVNTFNISLGTTVTDGGELNTLTGVLKVNTTPPTYSVVDPIAVKTFKGINNIWADTGDSMVTYKETLKHKIDKEA